MNLAIFLAFLSIFGVLTLLYINIWGLLRINKSQKENEKMGPIHNDVLAQLEMKYRDPSASGQAEMGYVYSGEEIVGITKGGKINGTKI